MKVNKYIMKLVGYHLLNFFIKWNKEYPNNNILNALDQVGYEEYHNFWKCRLPLGWYSDILKFLNISSDDLLIEVARVKGDHAEDLHYHRISHAICIILGPTTKFPEVKDGYVIINNKSYKGYEDLECYFPTDCLHTFHGGVPHETNKDGSLYFISIQSPPLLTKDNDDFYFVK